MSSFPDGMDVEQAPLAIDQPRLAVRCIRPSLLDPYLPSEPSLAPCVCMPHVTVLYLDNRPIAIIQATSLDQAAFDSTTT